MSSERLHGLTGDDIEQLGRITTWDESGAHFTTLYADDWLDRMERAGLIEVRRPVHAATGIPYGQDAWRVRVTDVGVAVVDESGLDERHRCGP